MDYLWLFWVVAAVVFALAEVFTLGFVLLWFALGAVAAALLALAGIDPIIQVIAFLAVSIGLTVASRTIFEKFLSSTRGEPIKTGIDALPGQIGTVIESSSGAQDQGAVKVFGSTWTALPAEGEEPLEEGERVEVDRVDGTIIYVRHIRPRQGSWRS